jgi:hypothetical protein
VGNTGLGHSGYWSSKDVAITVAELLQLRSRRTLHERKLADATSVHTGRVLDERVLRSRLLQPRLI